jgi:hypothetical protein
MWGTILQVVLLAAEYFLKRASASAETMAAFYKFVHSANQNCLNSVAAGKAWRDQAGDLAAELDRRAAAAAEQKTAAGIGAGSSDRFFQYPGTNPLQKKDAPK